MPTTAEWVRVGAVPYGKGVFARQAIPKGTLVGVVAGKLISDPDYASSYCIDMGDEGSLEPRAPFRYLNHSCEPNCQLYHIEVCYEDGSPAPSEIHVESIKPVREGEELTIDYAWSADGAIPCLCQAKRCRGWVVDPAERHLLPEPPRPAAAATSSKPASASTSRKGRAGKTETPQEAGAARVGSTKNNSGPASSAKAKDAKSGARRSPGAAADGGQRASRLPRKPR